MTSAGGRKHRFCKARCFTNQLGGEIPTPLGFCKNAKSKNRFAHQKIKTIRKEKYNKTLFLIWLGYKCFGINGLLMILSEGLLRRF